MRLQPIQKKQKSKKKTARSIEPKTVRKSKRIAAKSCYTASQCNASTEHCNENGASGDNEDACEEHMELTDDCGTELGKYGCITCRKDFR